jgi:hypothetical protein
MWESGGGNFCLWLIRVNIGSAYTLGSVHNGCSDKRSFFFQLGGIVLYRYRNKFRKLVKYPPVHTFLTA